MGKLLIRYKVSILLSVLVVLLVVFASQAFAIGRSDWAGNPSNLNSTTVGQGQNVPSGWPKKQPPTTSRDEWATGGGRAGSSGVPPFGRRRLEAAKLRVCQLREKNIVDRSNRMIRHANRMLEVFDSIATRIQNYYLTRLVPQGKILPNYDALVLDIQTKKTAVTPLLEAVTADVTNFKCDADDPRGQLDQFKEDIHAVIAGLKAYKRSVRNLIVAVASIRGAGDGNATGSATQPSVVPSVAP